MAGAVSSLKSSLYSCWTFSTVAALESAHAIKTGMMILLSEQQVCYDTSFSAFVSIFPDTNQYDFSTRYPARYFSSRKKLTVFPSHSSSPSPPPISSRILRAAGGLRGRLQQPRLQRRAPVAGLRVRPLQRRSEPHGRLPLRLRRRTLRPDFRALPVRRRALTRCIPLLAGARLQQPTQIEGWYSCS